MVVKVSTVLKSSDLKGMSRAEKRKAFTRMLESAPSVDSAQRVRELRAEIAELEERFGMTTPEMLARVTAGELREEGDIAAWVHAYMILSAHEENVRRSATGA